MAVGMRIVYTCDHIVENVYTEVKIIQVKKSNTLTDSLLFAGDILSVENVYQGEEDPVFFYENINYTFTSKEIKWIPSPDMPSFDSDYYVECLVKLRSLEQFEDLECPRCMGNSWYCSLTESRESTGRFFGVNKMVQEFIKCIFTRRSSNGGTYGTHILDYIGKNVSADNSYITEIGLMIKDAERQCKNIQNDSIINGDFLSNDEILEKSSILRIYFDESNSGIIADIQLSSKSGVHKNIAIGVN